MESIILQTARLKIVALDIENLYHYVNNYCEVQVNLGTKITIERQDPEVSYVFSQLHYSASSDPLHYYWYTSWEMIHSEDNVIVGGLCFKGPPNSNGEVELGYAIESEYQNNGYATEGVNALLNWLRESTEAKEVKSVVASVEKNNRASQKVLLKAGFIPVEEKDEDMMLDEANDLLWWRVEI